MLILASLAMVGLGLYFVLIRRPPLLPEDGRYIGASGRELEGAGPNLAGRLGHVFRVMGGFIVAADS